MDTGTYMSQDGYLLWSYDVMTTYLKSIIFPLLLTFMELFQILSCRVL